MHVELVKVKIVDAEDNFIEDKTEASDDNIELAEQKVPPIPDKTAGIFVCKTCDFAAKSKHELKSHKVSKHHWCQQCFSTFDSQDTLQNHASTKHKKSNK